MSDARRFDVIVVGAGAWGSAAAQHLATRKRRVLCIDRFRPPHTLGSTHGHSRHIGGEANTASSSDRAIVQRCHTLWHQLEQASGRHLLERVGYFYVGLPNSQRMAPSVNCYPDKVLSEAEIVGLFPQFRLRPGEVAIFDADAARLDPEACVAAALEIAERSGAVLRFDERAIDWTAQGTEVEVVTSAGRYRAEWLVLALGAWTSELAKVNLPLWAERQVMVWYANADATLPGFSFAVEPPATSLYGLPEADGRVKVAFHYGGPRTDPDSVTPPTKSDIDAVHRVIAERVPALIEVTASATCLYPNSRDYKYALGPHPSNDHVIILAGGTGHGFHQAPIVGEFAADCVDGRPRLDMASFSLNRFAS